MQRHFVLASECVQKCNSAQHASNDDLMIVHDRFKHHTFIYHRTNATILDAFQLTLPLSYSFRSNGCPAARQKLSPELWLGVRMCPWRPCNWSMASFIVQKALNAYADVFTSFMCGLLLSFFRRRREYSGVHMISSLLISGRRMRRNASSSHICLPCHLLCLAQSGCYDM